MRDLLQGFVLEDWVKELDLETLERVNGSYVSDDLREREDDIIWRVQLEKSRYPEDIRKVVSSLVQWLKSPEQATIRRAFTVWINRVLLPVRLPEQEVPHVNDLLEMETMLAERVKEWTKEWKEEGMQEGLQKGSSQILHHMLTAKFGSLSPELESRLKQANNEKLLQWSKRLLTADSLGEIFGH